MFLVGGANACETSPRWKHQKGQVVLSFHRETFSQPEFVLRNIVISNTCCSYTYLDRCSMSWLMKPSHATQPFPVQTALSHFRINTLCFPELMNSTMSYESPPQLNDNKMAMFCQRIQHCTESFGRSVLQGFILRMFNMSVFLNSKSEIPLSVHV